MGREMAQAQSQSTEEWGKNKKDYSNNLLC